MTNEQYSKPLKPYLAHEVLRKPATEARPSVFDPTVNGADLEQSLIDGLSESAEHLFG